MNILIVMAYDMSDFPRPQTLILHDMSHKNCHFEYFPDPHGVHVCHQIRLLLICDQLYKLLMLSYRRSRYTMEWLLFWLVM